MIVDLKKRENKPIYECLYEFIKAEIISGRLKKGEKLPSRRQMALDNGIAEITVANAYAQLVTEGYIESREKSGYYVLALSEQESEQRDESVVLATIGQKYQGFSNVHADLPSTGANEKQHIQKIIANFSDSSLPENTFPFDTWSKLTRRILSMERSECIKSPSAQGIPELRKAIADYLERSRGFSCDPSRIVIAPGTEYLNEMLLKLIGGVSFVAMEDPGYPAISRLYENSANKCIHIPVDESGLITDELKDKNIKMVHVSPSHHFPLGVVMSASRRAALAGWASENDAWIVEDDYDSEFRFEGRPVPPLASSYPDRVVYMNTFSRTLSPSIRVAFMVLPKGLYDIYNDKMTYRSGGVSTLNQLTLRSFISEGYYERHINRMKNFYRKRKNAIREIAENGCFSEFFECEGDGSGMMFLLKPLPGNDILKNGETIIKKLENQGIILNSVNDYCYNKLVMTNNRYIVNFGHVTEENFERASQIICDVLRKNKCRN